MGYACPVCGTPQADATHLANHLAFTALVRGGEHRDWLDERCPGWEEAGEAELAERVVEYAAEEPFPDEAGEDGPTDGDRHRSHGRAGAHPGEGGEESERGRDHGHRHDREHGGQPQRGAGVATREGTDADDVLERARDLTRQRRANRDATMDERGRDPADGNEDGDEDGGEK